MTVKELYRYERETGKVTVSTEKPEGDYSLRYRLIADEKKLLTQDGENFISCVDVETIDGWYEINEKSILVFDEILPEDNQIIYAH